MKPTELRIGNICLYKINGEEKGKEIIIDAQDLVAISQFSVANKTSPYYAIPLTEKWLKKFGFKKSIDLCFFLGDCLIFVFTENNGKLQLVTGGDETIIDEIKYVHQLQNIYHALREEELKLK